MSLLACTALQLRLRPELFRGTQTPKIYSANFFLIPTNYASRFRTHQSYPLRFRKTPVLCFWAHVIVCNRRNLGTRPVFLCFWVGPAVIHQAAENQQSKPKLFLWQVLWVLKFLLWITWGGKKRKEDKQPPLRRRKMKNEIKA